MYYKVKKVIGKMKHFCLPLFNRATYSRCRSVIEECERRSDQIKLTVILGSSLTWETYGNASQYIRQNHPDIDMQELKLNETTRSSKNMAKDIGNMLSTLVEYFDTHRFDGVIVVADRYETIAAALAANSYNIPLVHIQGGELTRNIDERIRHAVTALSDYHFVSTFCAKKIVEHMGHNSDRVLNFGCPSLDLLKEAPRSISDEAYIMLQYHPVTDEDCPEWQQMSIIMESVMEFCYENLCRCYVYSPNPDPGREEIEQTIDAFITANPDKFTKIVNEPNEQFLDRLRRAMFIIGNSSCGVREAGFIGVPAINIGPRQGIRERSWNVVDIRTISKANLKQKMAQQHNVKRYEISHLYGSGIASDRIVDHLADHELTLRTDLNYPSFDDLKEFYVGEKRYDKHRVKRQLKKGHHRKTQAGA